MLVNNQNTSVIGMIIILSVFSNIACNPHPQIDIIGGYDIVGVCIRNCAQCKTMLGGYFNGELCAESCLKFDGKIIPDCENFGSIAPFLNKIE